MTTRVVLPPLVASGAGRPPTQSTDVNSDAVPSGAAILGSSGPKPSGPNGLAFVTPTVPVHIDATNTVWFFVNNQWFQANNALTQPVLKGE